MLWLCLFAGRVVEMAWRVFGAVRRPCATVITYVSERGVTDASQSVLSRTWSTQVVFFLLAQSP